MDAVSRYQPARILEIGAGIGTLTAAILATAPVDASIVSVEDNDFCLSALRANLGDQFNRILVVSSVADVSGQFDLVIVDGHQIMDVTKLVAPSGFVFVEGDRPLQRGLLDRAGRPYAVKHVRTVRMMSADDPWEHAAWERYQGGYWLTRYEPSPSDRRTFKASDWWNSRIIGSRRRVRRLFGLERRAAR